MNENTKDRAPESGLLHMTTDVIVAYVRNNPVQAKDLTRVIHTVHDSLSGLTEGRGPQAAKELKPAVPIKKSVTPSYIVCLEDGKKLKMLKRHLRTSFSLTPEEYRRKWGLPPDYPMVAPNYAKERSTFAKKIGLGKTKEK